MEREKIKLTLDEAMGVEGALAAGLVDFGSGVCLQAAGDGLNHEIAAAGNTEVVRAEMRTLRNLGLKDSIEDVLISMHVHYHLIRLLSGHDNLLLYLVLDRSRANLAAARLTLREIEAKMQP